MLLRVGHHALEENPEYDQLGEPSKEIEDPEFRRSSGVWIRGVETVFKKLCCVAEDDHQKTGTSESTGQLIQAFLRFVGQVPRFGILAFGKVNGESFGRDRESIFDCNL